MPKVLCAYVGPLFLSWLFAYQFGPDYTWKADGADLLNIENIFRTVLEIFGAVCVFVCVCSACLHFW